tara:strand:- start:437 stop:934 length:498 start_codon:yes stop_codon:yes gene_type:complete
LIDLKEIQNKILIKENFYFLLIISLIFLLDRYSKILILKDFSNTVFYVNNFLNFDLIWNTGIGFGLLSSDSSFFYNNVSVLIGSIVVLLFFIALKADKFDKIILSCVIGGALGNFYDRIVYKAVPDFIDFHYGNFHWFTFNVADIFITVGILFYLINGYSNKKDD